VQKLEESYHIECTFFFASEIEAIETNKLPMGGQKRQLWCHLIGIDSLFQKTPIITPKKRTVQQ
jgi:hypothetical protein